MTPSWRKPVGVLLLLAFITAYATLVATLADIVLEWPLAAQLLFFSIAGIAWIFPIRPLLTWMETGKFP